ncbi:hypothetical protein Hanom_Chr09g00784971 [Helianthus anomalus]
MDDTNIKMNPHNLSSSSPPASSSTSGTSWFSGIVGGRKSTTSTTTKSAVVAAGPINRKNQFCGVMFKYASKPIQVFKLFFMGDFGNLDIGFIEIGSVFEFDRLGIVAGAD